MKKGLKIFLGIVLALAACVAGLCVWQRDNIGALVKTMTSTDDEIAQEMNDKKKELEDELKKNHANIISDFSADEERQILNGELSVEDAVSKLNEKYETEKKSSVASQSEIDKVVGDKVIELYSLKAYYLGQLGQIEASVKSEYKNLPKEKKNLVGKQELVNRYMGKALGLMNQCDARVETLLAELKSELQAMNADTAIIKTIRDAYENEKNLKKAYYLKLLEG